MRSGEPFARGQCQCGEIAFEIVEAPLATWVCYCTECQKLSAGVQSTTMGVPAEHFRLTRGRLKTSQRGSDSGRINEAHFCGTCGNRIYHLDPDHPEELRVKTGALEDQSLVNPEAHLWLRSKPAWVPVPPGGVEYQTQDTAEAMLAAIEARRGQRQ